MGLRIPQGREGPPPTLSLLVCLLFSSVPWEQEPLLQIKPEAEKSGGTEQPLVRAERARGLSALHPAGTAVCGHTSGQWAGPAGAPGSGCCRLPAG